MYGVCVYKTKRRNKDFPLIKEKEEIENLFN